MTGPAEAVEIPTNQRSTKHVSFYEFLASYRSSLPNGDAVADLAADVLQDAKSPRRNTKLIDYLLRRDVPGDVIEQALNAWKAARDE
jgi:hypothetical protein